MTKTSAGLLFAGLVNSLLTCLSRVMWVSAVWVSVVSAGGVIEVGSGYYPQNSDFDSDSLTLETRLRYEQNWQLTDNSTLLFKPRLGLDNGNLYGGTATLHENNKSRSTFAIEELTFTQYVNNFEFSVGKQIFSWGMGDMYNSSDHVNSVDTLDPLDNLKLGQWGTSLLYLGNSSNINLVYIPRRSPSRLPQQNNRWFRSVQAIQTAAAAELGFTPEINLERQIDRHSASSGVQITSSQWLPNWDVELSYFHSQDATGVYLPEVNGTRLDLIRMFPSFDEASLGLSTAVGEYTFHSITSYRNTKNNQQDDDYFTFIVGARRTFYTSDFDAPELIQNIEDVTLGVEYVKEKISHHRDPDSNFVNTGFGRTLTNSILMSLELKFSEDTLLAFGVIENFDKQDRYFSMEFSHQFNDDFKISIGLDLLNGTSDSLFGEWTKNDRLYLIASHHF
ncbi:MAG: hypothetical protein ACI9FD_002126 [Gammaproteobacteria bacterium]|jgi:hypothetical protein